MPDIQSSDSLMQPIQASQLFSLSTKDRAGLIQEHADSVSAPNSLDPVLHGAYRISSVLAPALPDFFARQIKDDLHAGSSLEMSKQSIEIERECKKFSKYFIESMKTSLSTPEEMMVNPRNLYEMCGAAVLAESNSISRKLSTAMGNLWEIVASISPYAINPEADLGLKITGIDAIICDGQISPTFVQIKTQRNTLTGSQKNRSSSELKIHSHRLFAAAFCTGSGWTYSDTEVLRVCGEEFWSLIGMDYALLKTHIKKMVLNIESAYLANKEKLSK